MIGNAVPIALILVLVTASYALIILYKALYNVFFHPLSRFPGPRLAAISNFQHCYWFLSGKQPAYILRLHEHYGPIVRTSPNELSFNTSQSWKDIYNFRPGHSTFVKSEYYEGGSFAGLCGSIVSERDPQVHAAMRKQLSNAFSQKSLTEQEELISKSVDKFIAKLGTSGPEGTDISLGFKLMTFDVIGDLGFGETFRGIESQEVHPWIITMTGAMMQGALADTALRFPWVAKIALTFFKRQIDRLIKDTKVNEQYSINLVERRVNRDTNRKDFYTRILKDWEPSPSAYTQLAAHASDFVLAGSETSSTCLTTVIYHLLKNPAVASKLSRETRSAFKSYQEINAASTASLRYTTAVIQEGLRIFPPLPFGIPRTVPRDGDIVDGRFVPGGTTVSTSSVAASLDPANFHDPHNFLPERWLDQGDKDDLGASQPFSLGPRGCIGRSLGWMEMRTTLVKLIYKYDLELLSTETNWFRDARMHTLWVKPPLFVRVTAREL